MVDRSRECGTRRATNGWYCTRAVEHEGPCAAIEQDFYGDPPAGDLLPEAMSQTEAIDRAAKRSLRRDRTATAELIERVALLRPTGTIGDGMVAQLHALAARARREQGL